LRARLGASALQIHRTFDRAARYERLARLTERYAEVDRRNDTGSSTSDAGRDLTRFEYSVFSQNGEDGIICEMFRRIGDGTRFFVEFGIDTGIQGNCVFLAEVEGWQGLFMEARSDAYDVLAHRWRNRERVQTRRTLVGPENINRLLDDAGVPAEPAIVSIDIDGNDYYVWEAMERKPHVVVIEYNSNLPLERDRPLVQPYSPGASSSGPDYSGASLGALESLGVEKGYVLVHTDLTGINAFFARADLAGALPQGSSVPRRAANYYFSGRDSGPTG
jgi:hypothetical protein